MAKPEIMLDGTVNLMVWHCIIPHCNFSCGFLHLQCLFFGSYVSVHPQRVPWVEAFHTVMQILVGIQDLLDQP
ncbi:hypothetical protein GQ457_10G029050 [Hibiscus cannabinus]